MLEGNTDKLLLTAGSWFSATFSKELLDRLVGLVFGVSHNTQGAAGFLGNILTGLLFVVRYLASHYLGFHS